VSQAIDQHIRQQAIQTQHSFLVQAPAGSGKTELLIQRILALLAIVDEPEEILALTFTRKAAAEMRERVISALQAGLQPEPAAAHAKTTWKLAKAALAQSESKQWRLIQYPARLRMMTIDAFASGLARQLPILSGFGQTPSTAEFTQPLYQDAVASLFAYIEQKNTPAQIKQAFDVLALHLECNMQKLSDLLCAMLAQRDQWLPVVYEKSPDMQVFQQHLSTSLTLVMEHALDVAYKALPIQVRGELPSILHQALLHLQRDKGANHAFTALADLQTFPAPCVDDLPQWKAIVDMLMTAPGSTTDIRKTVNVNLGFPSGPENKAHKDAMLDLLKLLQGQPDIKEALIQVRALPDSNSIEAASWEVLESLFILLKLLAAMLWQSFASHKKVDFLEIMLRAKQALGETDANQEIVPSEALLRLDYQIQHILVDEFQDTNALQIDVLSRLTAGWNHDGRSLFMVGDPMQSIYRFRKAEVSLFLQAAKNELPLPDVTFLSLSQNFRSEPEIVTWVNQAFSQILPKENDALAGAICYAPSLPHKSGSGQVELCVFDEQNDETEAKEIITIIQQALSKQQRVGVLARTRSHLHGIMQSLQQAKIAFRALDILPLHQQSEIIDLRSLTAALLHPCDDIAWASLLRMPVVGLELSTIFALCQTEGPTLWQKINTFKPVDTEDQQRLSHLLEAISPSEAQAGRIPLRRLVESAWLRLAVPATLASHQMANADVFFQLLEQLEDEGRLDLSTLDARLAREYAKPESAPNAEWVELTTMHSAKGLQWDVVILPGLGKSTRASDKPLLAQTYINTTHGKQFLIAPLPQHGDSATFDLIASVEKQRDTLEVARLLYVACTRAEQSLWMFGHISAESESPRASSLLAYIWQDTTSCYGANVRCVACQTSANTFEPIKANPPHRMAANYVLPAPAAAIPARPIAIAMQGEYKPEFSWAGASAKAVGIALHAALQRVAEKGIEYWQEKDNQTAMQLMRDILKKEGISEAHIGPALKRCQQGLAACQQSQRAKWILSGNHEQAFNEWALSYFDEGSIRHIVLDRCLIDSDGVRWIIDYKTGGHEGAGVEAFLDHELHRYTVETPQLPNYVKAMRALEPERTIKAALYFPMLDGWRVWQDD